MPKFEMMPYKPGQPCPAGFKIHTYRSTRRRPEITVCLRKRDLKAEKAAEVAQFNELANLFGKTTFGRNNNSPPRRTRNRSRSRSRSRSRNRSPIRNRGNTRRNNRNRGNNQRNRLNTTYRHYTAPTNNYRNAPSPDAAVVIDADNLDDALFEFMRKMKL
jgi:hypothetical protein